MDQLRADVLLDLLAGKSRDGTATSQGMVDITIGLDTLAGLADDPGEVAGYGPVIADTARHTVDQHHDAERRFSVTHPQSGQPLHVGVTKRRPTASIRRTVQATYRTCIFPGCRMPARGCDLDHRIPWTHSGPTTAACLAPLCRHDHRVRHRGWTGVPPVSRTLREWALSRLEGSPIGRGTTATTLETEVLCRVQT